VGLASDGRITKNLKEIFVILVTGATGTNGSEIVKQLSVAGVRVRAFARNLKKLEAIKGPNVEIAQGDLAKPETIEAALKGVDKVLLLSSVDPFQVELQGNLIAVAKRIGTPYIVKFSGFGADPASFMKFAQWHGKTEKQLEESGIAFTHLQPNVFMQNMLGFTNSIASPQGVFYLPMKDGKVSMVDVRDIAAVAVKVLTESGHEGKKYVITGPEALSFEEVAEKISQAIGKQVTYVNVSPEDFKQAMVQAGQPSWLADSLNELYAVLSAGHGSVVTSVIAEVAKKQPYSFNQFAQDYAEMFKGH
jgi:uncharacterized protein YbjT (DUF2867 family)